ncbi:Transposase IS66 family [hydrothermal vent metagenome]|uniref:Transposase IS66 family n=1 Tax=hydrothermal vent metagenome TaxID=652676 RepID=A0A3B1DL55_9ZZZZ
MYDYWKSYCRYDCKHALCNAYHLRELTFLNKEEKQVWALKLKQFLRSVKRLVDYAKKKKQEGLSFEILMKCEKHYDEILEEGFIESLRQISEKPKRGREKQTKEYNMLRRLKNHKSEALAFLNDFKVPFDNNQAERDIRMNKVRQKISGTFRGETSHEDYCRIRSYVSTLKKNGENVLNCLVNAFKGSPWFPTLVGS